MITGEVFDVVEKLKEINAQVVSYQVGSCECGKSYIHTPSAVFPTNIKSKVGLRPIEITVDFCGSSRYDAETKASEITSLLLLGLDLKLPDGFLYDCVYISSSDSEEKAPWIVQKTYKLLGIRHSYLYRISLTESGAINVWGNLETPAVIIATPSAQGGTIIINDMQIKNVTSTLRIDGIRKKVTENSQNKFADTILNKFPSFKPGENLITFSGASRLNIEYYAIFL